MSATTAAWLVLAFPLAGTLVNALGYRALPGKAVGYIGTLAIFGAFVFAVVAFFALRSHDPDHRQLVSSLWDYAFIPATTGVNAKLSILVDPLSVYMILVVSGVSALIHLYSVTYLWSDRGYSRFFTYLNYFIFSILLLILTNNFLILIIK